VAQGKKHYSRVRVMEQMWFGIVLKNQKAPPLLNLTSGEGKSNFLGIPLFLLLFLFLAFLLEVPKGTLKLRKIEGKGKAS